MEMERAAGTMTQVLSVVDRPSVLYESVRPALENKLNRPAALPRQHPCTTARAKLSDYIELILHCKAASSAPIRLF